MKTQYVVVGGLVTVIAAYMYYSRKAKTVQEADVNPNASTDVNIGNLMANSTYQGVTGAMGDTVTQNYRYSEYQQYMQQGGTNSGASFDQFLTAAQGTSLPLNS